MKNTAALSLLLLSVADPALSQSERPSPSKTIEQRLSDVETSILTLEAWRKWAFGNTPHRGSFLDCDDGDYAELIADSGFLVFLAACEKVEPYLEGFRLTIAVGNPHNADFSDFKGTLGYGDTFIKAFDQSVAISTTLPMKAGGWTRLVATINPATAKDIRSIYLRFSVSTARLPK